MACTIPDLACNNTDMTSSKSNQASCTPDYSYLLVSSTSFSSSSLISVFLVHNSNIIAEHKVMSSLSISPWHDHELTLSTAYTDYRIHRVQRAPSTAYTEYSIHRVQRPPKIVCLPFIPMIMSGPLNEASASRISPYTIDRHQPAHHESSKVKSPCLIPTFASQQTDELSLSTRCAVHRPPSKYSSNLARSRPSSSHDHGLHVQLQTQSLTASK